MFDIGNIQQIKKRPASVEEKKRLDIDINEDFFVKMSHTTHRVFIDSESGNKFTVTYQFRNGEWFGSLREKRKVYFETKSNRLNSVTIRSPFDCDHEVKELHYGSFPVVDFFSKSLPSRFPNWPNLVKALYFQFQGTLIDG